MTAPAFGFSGSIGGYIRTRAFTFWRSYRAFPFPIRKLQCHNGHEFPFAFVLAVQALEIRHRFIKPRRPQENGKVERSHRIDQEELWGCHQFPDFEAAAAALLTWERQYNYERLSLAIQNRTPAENRPPTHFCCLIHVHATTGRPGSILTRPNIPGTPERQEKRGRLTLPLDPQHVPRQRAPTPEMVQRYAHLSSMQKPTPSSGFRRISPYSQHRRRRVS